MEPEFEFIFQRTKREYYDAQYAAIILFQKKFYFWLKFIFSVLVLWLIVRNIELDMFYSKQFGFDFFMIGIYVFLISFVILISYLGFRPKKMAKQIVKFLIKRTPNPFMQLNYSFYNECISIESEQGRLELKYSAITKLAETEHSFLFFVQKVGYAIDKQNFAEGQLVSLKNYMEQKTNLKVIWCK